jgi:hypothetical protein
MNRKKLLIGISLIALSTSLGGGIAYAKKYAEKPPLPQHTLTQDPRQLHTARKDAAKRLKVVVDQKRKERLNSIAHQQKGYSGKGDGPSHIGG